MTINEILYELAITMAPEGHHHITHGRIQIDCPWCSPSSRKWRLGIKTAYHKGYCNCWTCGRHRLIDTLIEASGKPFSFVKRLVGEFTVGSLKERPSPRGKLRLPAGRGVLLPAHRRYLKRRGFDPDQLIDLWDISGIGIASIYSWRIVIPFFHEGEIVSWLTRSISDKTDRPYLSAGPEDEKIYHKDLLYGEDYCGGTIIIEEGPLDVWAVGPGSVATCGLGYSRAQLLRMVTYPCRVVLFDNEPEAQKRAEQLCDELSAFDGDTFNVVLETGKDASRADKKEIKELRRRFLDE